MNIKQLIKKLFERKPQTYVYFFSAHAIKDSSIFPMNGKIKSDIKITDNHHISIVEQDLKEKYELDRVVIAYYQLLRSE